MSGWVPMDVTWWPVLAEVMPKPWQREAVLFDLRWWADGEQFKRGKRPGRPTLMARWGWDEWEVRKVLASVEEWADPSKDSPASLQRVSSGPPADLQPDNGQTPGSEANPPATLQRSSSDSPAALQGVPESNGPTPGLEALHPHPTPTPNTHKTDVGRVWTVYRAYHPRASDKPPKGWAVEARVKEHGAEAVAMVVRWAHTSTHQRAQFLREKDLTGETLFRASKFPEYLEFARSAALPPDPARPIAAPSPDLVEAFVGDWQRLKVSRYEGPAMHWTAEDPETRRRCAAVGTVEHAWMRWCRCENDFDRKRVLDDLRNAYRAQLAKEAA